MVEDLIRGFLNRRQAAREESKRLVDGLKNTWNEYKAHDILERLKVQVNGGYV